MGGLDQKRLPTMDLPFRGSNSRCVSLKTFIGSKIEWSRNTEPYEEHAFGLGKLRRIQREPAQVGVKRSTPPRANRGARWQGCAQLARELKRKHVTLAILWDEYVERNPEGYRYSRFCELYRSWEGKLSVTMRQTHVGGDKLFVDYAGDTVPVIIDRLTGEVRAAQIFVAEFGECPIQDQRTGHLIPPEHFIRRSYLDGPAH
jgi:hypothetical protein